MPARSGWNRSTSGPDLTIVHGFAQCVEDELEAELELVGEVELLRRRGNGPLERGAVPGVGRRVGDVAELRLPTQVRELELSENALVRRLLVETAWHYQHRPSVGVALTRRRKGQPGRVIAIADKAQQRLCRRFRRLAAEHKPGPKIAVAIAPS